MEKTTVTAIPVYSNRLAFHFAWCTHVIFVETIGNTVLRQYRQPMHYSEPWDMARALVAMNIDQLACVTMPDYFRDWFESKHVRIIDCQPGAEQELAQPFNRQIWETGWDEDGIDGI